mgnify:CR=1 FL=1
MSEQQNFSQHYTHLQAAISWVNYHLQKQILKNANVFLEVQSLENKIKQAEVESFIQNERALDAHEVKAIVDSYGQSKAVLNVVEKPKWEASINFWGNEFSNWSQEEQLVLILAALPHVQPTLLNALVKKLEENAHYLPGRISSQGGTFLPTGRTALFLLAGNNPQEQLLWQSRLFNLHHRLSKKGILTLGEVPKGEPKINGLLQLSESYLHWFINGTPYRPVMDANFPAEKLTTQLNWEDLVVPDKTQRGIDELLDWIKNFTQLKQQSQWWGDRKGYRCLMYGSPGTGKTLMARLLSKAGNREVWRVDASKIVSKYVGETTKNLQRMFEIARHQDVIMFIDEGEGLFSNRSKEANSAQDTFVNQDIGYLLQAIEEYPGIMLVATNNLSNMDDAFLRRFDTRIEFELPNDQILYQLWKRALQPFDLQESINLQELSYYQAKENRVKNNEHVQVTGAKIALVRDYLTMQAIKKDNWLLTGQELVFALEQKKVYIPRIN